MQFINDGLVRHNKNLLEMGEAVLKESISRAILNFGSKHYDDAALVSWQFTPTKPNTAPTTTTNENNVHMNENDGSQSTMGDSNMGS